MQRLMRSIRRVVYVVAVIALAFWFALLAFRGGSAVEVPNRSVTLNTAVPSATSTHTFRFDYLSSDAVGSIVFEYCANDAIVGDPCTQPSGLDVTGAALSAQSGNTGFTNDPTDTTANKLVISRQSIAANPVASLYQFTNVTNPSQSNYSYFVRITTHASMDGSGPDIDNGGVAFATTQTLSVYAYIPPFLQMCVGVTVAINCSQTVGDFIDLGILTAKAPSVATSQFSTATNDPDGYSVYVLGTTMTSGNNTLPALAPPATSKPGQSQFGLNLRQNNKPSIGADPDGNGTGVPASNYAVPNLFTLTSGDAIASSPLPSDYTRMTSSYLVNVSPGQAPGVYTTTLTYVASVEF